jgi:hypothetical protein
MRVAPVLPLVLASSLLWALPVLAQPTPDNLCIQQVGEQYLALTKEPDTSGMTGTADLPWSQQLTALASQIRQNMTFAQIKGNQATLAERNVSQLLEQLRQAQAQMSALRKDLDQRTGEATLAPAPRN